MLHCEMCDGIEKTKLVGVGSSSLLGEGRDQNTLIAIDLLIFHWILCIYNAANTNMNMKLSAGKMFLCVMKKPTQTLIFNQILNFKRQILCSTKYSQSSLFFSCVQK